uniref:Uncharacterized protein n=1 Tax=Cacopsylla melanoneura TaxID=428564 RepID=A0A8D8YGU3_9HEMI
MSMRGPQPWPQSPGMRTMTCSNVSNVCTPCTQRLRTPLKRPPTTSINKMCGIMSPLSNRRLSRKGHPVYCFKREGPAKKNTLHIVLTARGAAKTIPCVLG